MTNPAAGATIRGRPAAPRARTPITPPARPVTWPFPATLPPSTHPPLHAAIDAATAALIEHDRLRNALTAAGIALECAVHLAVRPSGCARPSPAW
jgi:hypothetical protein